MMTRASPNAANAIVPRAHLSSQSMGPLFVLTDDSSCRAPTPGRGFGCAPMILQRQATVRDFRCGLPERS
jgi:hypothetical protein